MNRRFFCQKKSKAHEGKHLSGNLKNKIVSKQYISFFFFCPPPPRRKMED